MKGNKYVHTILRVFFAFAVYIVMVSDAFAQTIYYLDATGGNNSNNGTSVSSAWKTISKVNSSSFSPNDQILFKRGEVWREELIVPSSGSEGNHILFGAYGTGDRPVIMGSEAATGWTNVGGNVWKASVTPEPKSVFFVHGDDTIDWGVEEASQGEVSAEFEWHWAANELFIYSTSDPAAAYQSVEAQARNNCVRAKENNTSYIIVENLEAKFGNMNGIGSPKHSNGWIIRNNFVHHIGVRDTEEGNLIGFAGSNGLCSNNILGEGGRHGVFIGATEANFTNKIIEHNEIYNCYHNNISILNLSGTNNNITIRYNTIYWTEDAKLYWWPNVTQHHGVNGMIIQGATEEFLTENVEIHHNVIFNMPSFNILLSMNVENVKVYNNTLYENREGLSLSGCLYIVTDRTVVVKNNIGMNWETHGIVVENPINKTFDHNLWYQASGGSDIIAYVGKSYTDFETYKSTTGFDTHGFNENPYFTNATVNPLAADFTLTDFSLAIDAGEDVGLTIDYAGNPVPNFYAPDIGAYESIVPSSLPVIESVVISPNSGYAKVGDNITITATARNNETGLTPSTTTINGKQVTLTDHEDGTYVGVYTIAGGDNDGENVEATNITLTSGGHTSQPGYSSGSTLIIDANTPTISSVKISPNAGSITTGDSVIITATEASIETVDSYDPGDSFNSSGNRNFRVNVLASDINSDGGIVRVTLPAHTTENITVTGVYIGEKASSGDAFDMEPGTVTEITFDNGNSNIRSSSFGCFWC